MGHRLVFVGDELQLAAVRQVGDANHLAEHQLAHIRVDVAGNVGRQALDFHFAQQLLQDAALHLHPGRFALQQDGHADPQHLVHGDALQINVQQRALDGLVLPVDDHHLGGLAVEAEIENRVVPGLRVQDAPYLLGIDGDGRRSCPAP